MTLAAGEEVRHGFVTDHDGRLVISNETIVLAGRVSDAGVIQAGTGYSVVHNGSGDYTVTFTTPLANVPIVNVTFDGSVAAINGLSGGWSNITTSGFDVIAFDSSYSPIDSGFNFTVTNAF